MYAVIGCYALVGAAVASMAIAMRAHDDPASTTANMSAMIVFAAVFVALAAVTYAPLLDGRAAVSGAARTRVRHVHDA